MNLLTPDRIVHGLIAVLFLGSFVTARQPKGSVLCFLAVGMGALLGSWIPDWDLAGGIGNHRSPLTHSALPAALLAPLWRKNRAWRWLVSGLSIGIASHLAWDSINYGNVVGIPGRSQDILFLIGNAAIVLGLAIWLSRASLENPYEEAFQAAKEKRERKRVEAEERKREKREKKRLRRQRFARPIKLLGRTVAWILLLPFWLIRSSRQKRHIKDSGKAFRQRSLGSSSRSPVSVRTQERLETQQAESSAFPGILVWPLVAAMWVVLFPIHLVRALLEARAKN